jgi:uncharacterized protein YlxW (UPF0749 family)
MILTEQDRGILIFAMQTSLLEECKIKSGTLGKYSSEIINFVKEEATYEQLLNLTFNENRKIQYIPSEVLECVASMALITQLEAMMIPDSLLQEKKKNDSSNDQWQSIKTWIAALRKDVTALEKELNELTNKVGQFVTDNLDDAVELEQQDIEDKEVEKEEKEEQEIKKAEAAGQGADSVAAKDKEE